MYTDDEEEDHEDDDDDGDDDNTLGDIDLNVNEVNEPVDVELWSFDRLDEDEVDMELKY